MDTCCVCGKELPNKWSVAARCAEPGCEARFCTLHAATWNGRCPAHGGSETNPLHAAEPDKADAASAAPAADGKTENTKDPPDMSTENPTPDETLVQDAKRKMPASRLRGVLSSVGDFAARAGKLAGDLVRRIRNEKDPEEMLRTIDASLAANKEKRKPLFDRNAALASEISAKKKGWETAPLARKKMLELELRNLLSEYKSNERQLQAFFDNENALTVVRGRLLEQIALGMRAVKEEDVDKLADDIDDAVADAENVTDAIADLEKAGKRRERESDAESFADALAAFDDVPAAPDPAAAPAAEPGPAAADPSAAAPVPEPPSEA